MAAACGQNVAVRREEWLGECAAPITLTVINGIRFRVTKTRMTRKSMQNGRPFLIRLEAIAITCRLEAIAIMFRLNQTDCSVAKYMFFSHSGNTLFHRLLSAAGGGPLQKGS